MTGPRERTGLAAEIFLWVAVAVLALVGVSTVLGDDLFSIPTRESARTADAGAPASRP